MGAEEELIKQAKQAKEVGESKKFFYKPLNKRKTFVEKNQEELYRRCARLRPKGGGRVTRVIAFACDFCGKLFLEDWDAETHAETCDRRRSSENREFVEKCGGFEDWREGLVFPALEDCPNPISQRF